MATKGDKDRPGKWNGDEVEDAPPGEAERAADRAEGNAPITVAEAAQRRRDDEAVGPLPEPAQNALSPERRSPRQPTSTRGAKSLAAAGVGRFDCHSSGLTVEPAE